jgi:hypothetical protein
MLKRPICAGLKTTEEGRADIMSISLLKHFSKRIQAGIAY